MEQKLRVKQVRSAIGQAEKIRLVMNGLGLRRIGRIREYKDNNCIRGMLNKVKHLVSYEIVKG